MGIVKYWWPGVPRLLNIGLDDACVGLVHHLGLLAA